MPEYKAIFVSALIVCYCIDFSRNASLSNVELKRYKHLIEGQGLYSSEDDVAILTAHNFRTQIYGKKAATLVEFYNSWCGFCQRFAPSWKALATELKGWKEMITIAAVDCSDDDNSPVCREFEIMAYPTLRYFPENYQEGPGRIGTEVLKGDDVHSHKLQLIKKIIQEQREGRGTAFPNILPYTYPNLGYLYDGVPPDTKYVFLIIEQIDSLIGPEIAFDLRDIPHIVVKYSFSNNSELARNTGVPRLPALLALDESHSPQVFTDGLNSRETMRKAIRDFLRPRAIDVPEVTTRRDIYTGKWIDVEVPEMSVLMEARERENLKHKIKKMGDVVFQADLETALRYSLKHEVGLVKTISDEKLLALIKYLSALASYFPFGRRGQEFLTDLKNKVIFSGDTLEGAKIAQWVQDAEQPSRQVFSSPPQWLACRGSSTAYRGYPCGLWKLFHYLTVNAAEQNAGNDDAYPREVLDAMHGYVKNFFGCSDCSRHFQEMAKEKDMKSVGSLDSAVLWLWMAHNTVNKRLHGDATEDPEFPKVQFPLAEHCPACKNTDTTWNLQEVLRYLKHVYSSINVRYIGSDTRVLHMGLQGSQVSNGSSSMFFQKVDATRLQEKDVRS